jgi:hypothetical protein
LKDADVSADITSSVTLHSQPSLDEISLRRIFMTKRKHSHLTSSKSELVRIFPDKIHFLK